MMQPVMALHQLDGYWESEPGNTITLYINLDYVAYVTPFGSEGLFAVKISETDEFFIVTEGGIGIASPEDVVREAAMSAALSMVPDDGEGN